MTVLLLFLTSVCARVALTAVLTFRGVDRQWIDALNESTRATNSYSSIRQLNFDITFAWMRSLVEVQWLVFADRGCDELMRVYPFVECHTTPLHITSLAYRVPYANLLLRRARELALARYLMYLNTDVVVLGNLPDIIASVRRQVREPHLLLTSNMHMFRPRQFYPIDSIEFLQTMATAPMFAQPMWACEYFIVDTANPLFESLPQFLIGRRRWDNFVMQIAVLHPRIAAVDITALVSSVHLDHGTETAPRDSTAMNAPGTDYNEQLATASGFWNYGNLRSFNYRALSNGTVAPSDDIKRVPWYKPAEAEKLRAWLQ